MSNYDKIVEYCAERVIIPSDIFTVESLVQRWKRPAALVGYPLIDAGILLKDKLFKEDSTGICGYPYVEIDGDLCVDDGDNSYYFQNILYKAIARVALSKRYRFGNDYIDSEGVGFREDFSGIVALETRKPYLEWVKGTFEQSEISRGKEKESVMAALVSAIKDSGYLVEVPVDTSVIREKIFAALDNLEGYLITWNYISGERVLVNKRTQRVLKVRDIFFRVFWALLAELDMKRISTTDKRVTIVLD